MGGMGGALSTTNLIMVTAFQTALRRDGLLVLLLVMVAMLASAGAARMSAAVSGDRLAGSGTATGFAEHPARRIVRVTFGVLWILDGLLQAQRAMPVGLPAQVVRPSAASSPHWVRDVVEAGLSIWDRHPIPAASSAVWIQIGLGMFLLVAPRGRNSQLAGAASVGWGLVVWVFGEAFGGIFGSDLSWLFGTPGAAVLYCVAGVLVALPEGAWHGRRLGRVMLRGFGVYLLGMAVLQAWPGRGSWQGQADAGSPPGSLVSMVQAMGKVPQPHALSSVLDSFASFDASHGWAVNVFVVVFLAGAGVGLLSGRSPIVAGAVIATVIVSAAVWVLVQDLGFLGGVGTDPNSMIPTIVLLVSAYLAATRTPAIAAGTVADVGQDALVADSGPTIPRSRRSGPRIAFGVTASLAAIGVVLVGVIPMAGATVNSRPDAIVSEAINGQPLRTDSPAPSFVLTDQRGASVSLASLRGRAVALTFLDPVCITDCRLIAQQFRRVAAGFGPAAAKNIAFVAIVANPTYRGLPVLRAFDGQEGLGGIPNWYYLTGSVAELRKIWASYKILLLSVGNGGMVTHLNNAYVIDAAGRLRAVLGADPGTTSIETAAFGTVLGEQLRAVRTP